MKIHCKYTGIKGMLTVYRDALRYRYMITEKALRKAKILVFREKHGHRTALEAFEIKSRALYRWKKQFDSGGKKPEALNDKSRAPRTKRKRLWPEEVIAEIKRLRFDHPNLGKEKLHPELKKFCLKNNLRCPQPKTIGRLMSDLGGLRMYPAKISHFGKIKPAKRRIILRKPGGFEAEYPGHCVALDTIEKHVWGRRYYVITFEDLYTRFSFAWETTSHASLAAKEFFGLCLKVFPFPIAFVLTDNGSEFMKHFDEELRRLHMIHYHTYPKTPKMNAHCERFNRTIQEEFVDYHTSDLKTPEVFNAKLIETNKRFDSASPNATDEGVMWGLWLPYTTFGWFCGFSEQSVLGVRFETSRCKAREFCYAGSGIRFWPPIKTDFRSGAGTFLE